MRVKLCARCPYTPQDLTGHYDPEAALHVCAKCDGCSPTTTHARPTGGEHAQRSPIPSEWRSEALRHLCLNGGYGWLQVKCHRCETEASIPLDCVRRSRDTPIWKLEASLKCRSCRKGVTPHRCT
jgi:hypothetical protein